MIRKPALVIFCLFVLLLAFPVPAYAAISSCTASVSPTTTYIAWTGNMTFTVTNGGSASAVWIKITSPSGGAHTVNSISASGWSSTNDGSSGTLTSGTLAASSSLSVTVNVSTVGAAVEARTWTVQMSDSASGTSPTSCTGSLDVAISGNPPAAPSISSIVISDISDGAAKVTWTTDSAADSKIDYGKTTDYGSSKSDSSSVTSHSLSLSDLSANTTYHYNLTSANSNGSGTSGDNTFVTAKSGTTTTTTTTGTTVVLTPTPVPTPVPDKSPPVMTILTDLSKPFAVAPLIKGKATDKSGVSSLEYSLDNGRNWFPVDSFSPAGGTSVTFEFTPIGLDDDNYDVRMRGEDTKGNRGMNQAITMVIDRLPPRVGANVYSLGPQLLLPVGRGTYLTLAGITGKLSLSAVGGPSTVELNMSPFDNTKSGTSVALRKNLDTGLWNVPLIFSAVGTYQLSTHSVDGVGNVVNRVLNTVSVIPGGRVVNSEGAPVEGVQVALYTLDPTSQQFLLWDSASYGQENPQITKGGGYYGFFTPPGSYFMEVHSQTFRTLRTNIFTLDRSLPITAALVLSPKQVIKIGFWQFAIPDIRAAFQEITVNVPLPPENDTSFTPIVGKPFPYFTLKFENKDISETSLHGRPTIVTLLNTWWPQATDQIGELEKLATNKFINIVAIVPQETNSRVSIFRSRGNYNIPIIADPDGNLIEPLGYQTVPTHFFLDRKGVVQKVVTGVLREKELFDTLSN